MICFVLILFRFRIDEHYIGEPPAIEITITNLNDNIDKHFLANLLQKCGATEEQLIYYHPHTKRHLGIARIVFMDVRSARTCIDRYNGKSVMGKELHVFHDAFGKEIKRIFDEMTTGKKPSISTIQPPQQLPTFGKEEPSLSLPIENDFPPIDYNKPYVPLPHGSAEHKGKFWIRSKILKY